jgi:hypothetical protein
VSNSSEVLSQSTSTCSFVMDILSVLRTKGDTGVTNVLVARAFTCLPSWLRGYQSTGYAPVIIYAFLLDACGRVGGHVWLNDRRALAAWLPGCLAACTSMSCVCPLVSTTCLHAYCSASLPSLLSTYLPTYLPTYLLSLFV